MDGGGRGGWRRCQGSRGAAGGGAMTIKRMGWVTTAEPERTIRDALSLSDSDALTLQYSSQNQETLATADCAEGFLFLCRKKLEA